MAGCASNGTVCNVLRMDVTLSGSTAAQIRAELGRRNMTRAALADAMGVSAMYVTRRLNGDTPISLDELALFARALGVSPAELIGAAA